MLPFQHKGEKRSNTNCHTDTTATHHTSCAQVPQVHTSAKQRERKRDSLKSYPPESQRATEVFNGTHYDGLHEWWWWKEEEREGASCSQANRQRRLCSSNS